MHSKWLKFGVKWGGGCADVGDFGGADWGMVSQY